MSRAGEVWENLAMESFFSNPTHRHSTLGYVSPIEFERAQEA